MTEQGREWMIVRGKEVVAEQGRTVMVEQGMELESRQHQGRLEVQSCLRW